MTGTVEDCVRSHIAWITLTAEATGGSRGREGGVEWAWVPPSSTMHLLFPVAPREADIAEIGRRADDLGARETALWSAVERRRRWLGDLGFRLGWQPWWMTAAPADVPSPSTDRARLVDHVSDIDAHWGPLVDRPTVLLAHAYDDGRFAGRAWLHLDGAVAGLYDMAVWPSFRRRGLGRDLLCTLVAEAGRRGAQVITLNATPEGSLLYAACGFERIGEGRTWWRRGPAPPA